MLVCSAVKFIKGRAVNSDKPSYSLEGSFQKVNPGRILRSC